MVKDQYVIPQHLHQHSLPESLQQAETFQYTPEVQVEAYQFMVDIKDRIDAYRQVYLETNKAQKKGILHNLGLRRQDLTLNDLIEAESQIINAKYDELYDQQTGYRVWLHSDEYHVNNASFSSSKNAEDTRKTGHFFHTRPVTYSNGKAGELAIHYEFEATYIIKWFNGKPYELSMSEIETVGKMARFYEDAVREKLYPLDDTLHELQEEVQQEVIAPLSSDDLESRTIASNLVADFVAKKAQKEAEQRYRNAA